MNHLNWPVEPNILGEYFPCALESQIFSVLSTVDAQKAFIHVLSNASRVKIWVKKILSTGLVWSGIEFPNAVATLKIGAVLPSPTIFHSWTLHYISRVFSTLYRGLWALRLNVRERAKLCDSSWGIVLSRDQVVTSCTSNDQSFLSYEVTHSAPTVTFISLILIKMYN